jgi:hypothetical protein
LRHSQRKRGVAHSHNDALPTDYGINDNTYAFTYPVKQNKQYNAPNSYALAVLDDGVSPATFQNRFPAPVFAAIPSNGILSNPDPSQADFPVPAEFQESQRALAECVCRACLAPAFHPGRGLRGKSRCRFGFSYNLNAPTTVLGGGNASKPLFLKYGRTADANIHWVGMSTHSSALQVKLNRRFTNGLAITTAYTWGKGMSYRTGDDGGLWSYYDQTRGNARTDFDRTQTFAQSYVYDLPFGVGKKWPNRGIDARFLGGWQVNWILMIVTGTPLTFGANGGVLNTPGTPQTSD